ncbi:hypothetical protein GGS23DRAFT_217125 [Durotheca rogersii]|uniref:uncharacterized protein n=1 Tax=Durotheca rogersii TaxID=419775 RepID=UPI00221F222E|nr:uncharacterized protein GGS23DRAFT_217125 [Durotheca rogersii]KAI5860927.1 hypothetical protein GGS23DRAFT_217125 [Durotheca rogersii]
MSPHKGEPKPGKATTGHTKRKHSAVITQSRPVVMPAIPLLMASRSFSGNQRVAIHPSSNGVPASSLEAALTDAVPASDSAKVVQSAQALEHGVNGFDVEMPEHAAAAANVDNPLQRDASHSDNGNNIPSEIVDAPVSVRGVNGAGGSSNAPRHTPSASSVADAESAAGSAVVSADHYYPGAQDAPRHVSQPQSAASSIRPEFHSLSQGPHLPHHPPPTDQFPDPTSRGGPPHMHPYHPARVSNGGIMFGGFASSHTPSPAPLPGGFVPPAPPPANGENRIHAQANGHHPSSPDGNGFPGPIKTQFRPEMMPMAGGGVEAYGQGPAPVPHPPYDPYSPSVARYGLSTPHSFHGSPASVELNGVENGVMPYPPPNGPPYGGHVHHEHPVSHFPPFVPMGVFARYGDVMDDGLVDSIRYLRGQFDNGELADCVLELVSTKGAHRPVKITGHKLILARSPSLRQHIMAARATDLGSHTITVESEDPFLRSDAWWGAVRRLYMYPLLTPVDITGFTSDKVDRFQFCLGYAAAGHILNMQDVHLRGLQMAADFLSWSTVEAALGFVLEGTTQRHVNYDAEQEVELEFGYGPETRLLLDATMNFLINAFPSDFKLDTSVGDSQNFARIPVAFAATSPTAKGAEPALAQDVEVRDRAKANRFSSIKFGDLPPVYPEDGTPQRSPAKCSPVLSRVLLNLPFYELCAVLTSASDGVSGWNSAQGRYHAVAGVVAEREARRVRAVEAVRSEAVPHYREIQQRLSAQRRHPVVEPWDVLNWQEEVVQPRGAEVPGIVRSWVPQFSTAAEAPQKQPRLRLYDAHKSMV